MIDTNLKCKAKQTFLLKFQTYILLQYVIEGLSVQITYLHIISVQISGNSEQMQGLSYYFSIMDGLIAFGESQL